MRPAFNSTFKILRFGCPRASYRQNRSKTLCSSATARRSPPHPGCLRIYVSLRTNVVFISPRNTEGKKISACCVLSNSVALDDARRACSFCCCSDADSGTREKYHSACRLVNPFSPNQTEPPRNQSGSINKRTVQNKTLCYLRFLWNASTFFSIFFGTCLLGPWPRLTPPPRRIRKRRLKVPQGAFLTTIAALCYGG